MVFVALSFPCSKEYTLLTGISCIFIVLNQQYTLLTGISVIFALLNWEYTQITGISGFSGLNGRAARAPRTSSSAIGFRKQKKTEILVICVYSQSNKPKIPEIPVKSVHSRFNKPKISRIPFKRVYSVIQAGSLEHEINIFHWYPLRCHFLVARNTHF